MEPDWRQAAMRAQAWTWRASRLPALQGACLRHVAAAAAGEAGPRLAAAVHAPARIPSAVWLILSVSYRTGRCTIRSAAAAWTAVKATTGSS